MPKKDTHTVGWTPFVTAVHHTSQTPMILHAMEPPAAHTSIAHKHTLSQKPSRPSKTQERPLSNCYNVLKRVIKKTLFRVDGFERENPLHVREVPRVLMNLFMVLFVSLIDGMYYTLATNKRYFKTLSPYTIHPIALCTLSYMSRARSTCQ